VRREQRDITSSTAQLGPQHEPDELREFSPEQALQVGFIDALVPAEQLLDTARDKAVVLLELDSEAHAISKKRLRADALRKIRTALPLDLKDAVVLGAKQVAKARLGR
jgi:enoyl-CoA hydratase/carnithine racemase